MKSIKHIKHGLPGTSTHCTYPGGKYIAELRYILYTYRGKPLLECNGRTTDRKEALRSQSIHSSSDGLPEIWHVASSRVCAPYSGEECHGNELPHRKLKALARVLLQVVLSSSNRLTRRHQSQGVGPQINPFPSDYSTHHPLASSFHKDKSPRCSLRGSPQCG